MLNIRNEPAAPDFATAFYLQYRDLMLRLARRLVDTQEDQEDLVQDTLCLLLRRLDLLETLAPCQVEAYIVRTMRNCVGMEYRRARHSALVDMADEDLLSLLDAQSDSSETGDMLIRLEVELLLKKLKPEDRILLEGWYLQQLSPDELGKKLGCKPDSIRTKLSRARKRAYEIMTKDEE